MGGEGWRSRILWQLKEEARNFVTSILSFVWVIEKSGWLMVQPWRVIKTGINPIKPFSSVNGTFFHFFDTLSLAVLHSKYIILLCYKVRKLNKQNQKTKKNEVWYDRLLVNFFYPLFMLSGENFMSNKSNWDKGSLP